MNNERVEIYAGLLTNTMSVLDSKTKLRHCTTDNQARKLFFVDYINEQGNASNVFASEEYSEARNEAAKFAIEFDCLMYDLDGDNAINLPDFKEAISASEGVGFDA